MWRVKARVGHEQGPPWQRQRGHEHAVVPVHIRKEVVKGQTLRGQPLQMGAQPGVEPAAAVAAASVAGQQQLGCFEAQSRAECPGDGGQRGRAAGHGNAALGCARSFLLRKN